MMNNDFLVLMEFLGRCGSEVSGRQMPVPQTEEAAKLIRFAQGLCDPAERKEVCALLQLHPAWIRWVADRIKLARRRVQSPGARKPEISKNTGGQARTVED